MHKPVFFSLLLITNYSLVTMENNNAENMVTKKNKLSYKADANRVINENNQTALHLKMLISQKEREKLQELDRIRSHEIAELYFAGATINHRDTFNKTAFEYAQENKDVLPNSYKVIRAIKTIAEGDSRSHEFKEAQKTLVENYLTMDS